MTVRSKIAPRRATAAAFSVGRQDDRQRSQNTTRPFAPVRLRFIKVSRIDRDRAVRFSSHRHRVTFDYTCTRVTFKNRTLNASPKQTRDSETHGHVALVILPRHG